MDFLLIYVVFVFFLTFEIKNSKIENVKKFINVKLYGEKPRIVIPPSKKGAKNTTNNLLLNIPIKLRSSLLINCIEDFFFNFIHFRIIFIFDMIITYKM